MHEKNRNTKASGTREDNRFIGSSTKPGMKPMAEPYTPVRSECEVNLQKISLRLFVRGSCDGRRRVLRQSGRSCITLYIVSIPGQITLQPVFHVRRDRKLVIFAGIDDQLRFTAQCF